MRSTLARRALTAGFAAFTMIAIAQLLACSASQPHDMNDGTDVGLFYVPPGGDNTVSDDAATVDVDSVNSADSAVVDGGTSAEAPVGSAM